MLAQINAPALFLSWAAEEPFELPAARRGDSLMKGLVIKTTDGNAGRSPLVKIAADAAKDMLRFAAISIP